MKQLSCLLLSLLLLIGGFQCATNFSPLDSASDLKEKFVYDEPPQPVGGMEAIQQNVVYPEIARKAGVEGTVVINVLIDESGAVLRTEILKSMGNNGCDGAAVEAIKSVEWKPATRDGKPVKAWITVSVVFRL